jgi:hypothetical protein
MFRSFFTRGAAALVALAAVSLTTSVSRGDEITQSELPTVVLVAGTSIGTQGFADIGAPSVVGGNINTGTSFTLGNLISTGAQAGYFAGLTTQIFGPASFVPGVGSGFAFGNATFGSFLSTSIVEQTNAPGERSFFILGNYTAGTFDPSLSPNPAPASLRLSFTQTPPVDGAISASATMAIPPVPEPSTLMLACVGLAGGLAVEQNRRASRRRAATAHDSATNLG